jgi:hemerythrin
MDGAWSAVDQLSDEHELMAHHYARLDEAIFEGSGSPVIVEAASVLAETILVHCNHEERLLTKIPFPFAEAQLPLLRDIRIRVLDMMAELEKGEVYAALHLRSLCKEWLGRHLHLEILETQGALVSQEPPAAGDGIHSA